MSYDPTRQVSQQGYPPQQPTQGYLPQAPQQGYPPQPVSGQFYPPQPASQGYPPQGYPSQGLPGQTAQAFPPGYPPQPAPAPHPAQPFASQPYAQPAPSAQSYPPLSAAAAPSSSSLFWARLGASGQVALLGGLVLVVGFFLPWLTGPDSSRASEFTANSIPTTTYSGFNTASGISLTPPYFHSALNFNLFAALWMAPLGGLALLLIAWLISQRRIASQTANLAIVIISIAVLVVVFTFTVEANALQNLLTNSFSDLFDGRIADQIQVQVAFGFWLGVIAAAAALLAGGYALLQGGKMQAHPYQQ